MYEFVWGSHITSSILKIHSAFSGGEQPSLKKNNLFKKKTAIWYEYFTRKWFPNYITNAINFHLYLLSGGPPKNLTPNHHYIGATWIKRTWLEKVFMYVHICFCTFHRREMAKKKWCFSYVHNNCDVRYVVGFSDYDFCFKSGAPSCAGHEWWWVMCRLVATKSKRPTIYINSIVVGGHTSNVHMMTFG